MFVIIVASGPFGDAFGFKQLQKLHILLYKK